MLPNDSQHARAAIARATLHARRHPDDADAKAHVDELRAEYRARQLEDHIRATVAAAPPLTAEQRSRLAVLLSTGTAA